MTRNFAASANLYALLLVGFVLLWSGCGKSNINEPRPDPAKPHSVTLTWTPSTSRVAGYNVYRESAPGGPAVKLTPRPIAGHEFKDTTVQAGKTYSYYVTSVNSRGVESAPTDRTTARVPSP